MCCWMSKGAQLPVHNTQCVVVVCCQVTEHVVADPVVAISVAKTTLVLVPRTLEAG